MDEADLTERMALLQPLREEDYDREVAQVRERLGQRRRRSFSDDENSVAPPARRRRDHSDDDDEPVEVWESVPVREDLVVSEAADEAWELGRWAGHVGPVTEAMMSDTHWPGVSVPEAFRLPDLEFSQTASALERDDPEFERFRHEHWRRHDRHFCWACCIKLSVEQTKLVPAYHKLISMMTSGFHDQPFDHLVRQIADLWHMKVRAHQPARGPDPGTGLDIPPHYWHLASIRRHMLEHAPSVTLDIESTYKTIDALSRHLLPAVMEREKHSRRLRVHNATLKLYLEIVKMKQASWRLVVQSRVSGR